MFQITVVFGDTPTQWSFMFRDELHARGTWNSLIAPFETPTFLMEDDFGQHCCIVTASVTGIMFEELDKSQLAWVERGLHQARTQAKAQQMASADPALRTAARGPAITSPFEMQRGFNGR